jgi:hypothetical protein
MMKIAAIAALIGSASAFAPANVGKVRLNFQTVMSCNAGFCARDVITPSATGGGFCGRAALQFSET